ncbi:hypothetical protein SELMODRAFT_163348 [Selaginella moellendorffii]|uniref:Uncharacterized protein n=1 Tax=Selaginella moellendorffii TaxID=88036 RepID=D8TEX4_SELML|nr:transmembrane protein 184A [Selaginella moellendorffii]EFJ04796.1 hypothetical protein SELMODRAFT_163348 [Selaginella moellendorffii]|eukprot:XP_002994135.1 transmembrane protein 184A [Selaginella moellendorffii]
MDITQMDARTLSLMMAGGCAMLAMHFTFKLVSEHLFYWKNPKEQKAILIIVLMAPLYAIDSFFGLVQITGSEALFTFLDAIKECYEALVIAKFLSLMYSYMGISMSNNVIPDEIKGRKIHNSFPMTLFLPHEVPLNQHTLKLLKSWTWQFVIIRPVLSILMISLQLLGMYEGPITWIISLVLNSSVTLAMYSLIQFYHLFAKELASHKPLAKFLCIKGVVFFSFWQGIVMQILASAGMIQKQKKLNVNQIEEAYQNLLVCLEMVAFAAIQQYAFSAEEYAGEAQAKLKAAAAEKKDD